MGCEFDERGMVSVSICVLACRSGWVSGSIFRDVYVIGFGCFCFVRCWCEDMCVCVCVSVSRCVAWCVCCGSIRMPGCSVLCLSRDCVSVLGY